MEYEPLVPIKSFEDVSRSSTEQMFSILDSTTIKPFGLLTYAMLDKAMKERKKVINTEHIRMDIGKETFHFMPFDNRYRDKRYNVSNCRFRDYPDMRRLISELDPVCPITKDVADELITMEALCKTTKNKEDPDSLFEIFTKVVENVHSTDTDCFIRTFDRERYSHSGKTEFSYNMNEYNSLTIDIRFDDDNATKLKQDFSLKYNSDENADKLIVKAREFTAKGLPELEHLLIDAKKKHEVETRELRSVDALLAARRTAHIELIEKYYKNSIEAYMSSKQLAEIV